MTPPAPCGPYASCEGMNKRHLAPGFISCRASTQPGITWGTPKGSGLATVDRRVEYRAVNQLAGIVDLDSIAGLGAGTLAGLEYLVLQARGQCLYLYALAVGIEELLAGLGVDIGHSGGCSLLFLLKFGKELLYSGLGLVVAHLGFCAIENCGYTVGEILYLDRFDTRACGNYCPCSDRGHSSVGQILSCP